MQWVQICAVTSSVAEACSSVAVLLLRLQLYLCFSHHRNCDASTLKPARYSSVQAALCISMRAALGSLVQAGSPCRSLLEIAPVCCCSGRLGVWHSGAEVILLLGSLFCVHMQVCRGYPSGAAHCASPDVQKQRSNAVFLIPSAHTHVHAHTQAARCLWAACSTAECWQLHRSPFALPVSGLAQLEHSSHWNMTHETFTAL